MHFQTHFICEGYLDTIYMLSVKYLTDLRLAVCETYHQEKYFLFEQLIIWTIHLAFRVLYQWNL